MLRRSSKSPADEIEIVHPCLRALLNFFRFISFAIFFTFLQTFPSILKQRRFCFHYSGKPTTATRYRIQVSISSIFYEQLLHLHIPKVQKDSYVQQLFAHLGSACINMFMKSTPGCLWISFSPHRHPDDPCHGIHSRPMCILQAKIRRGALLLSW
jgi:hypothetical protein